MGSLGLKSMSLPLKICNGRVFQSGQEHGLGSLRPPSWLCLLLALQPWATHLAFPGLMCEVLLHWYLFQGIVGSKSIISWGLHGLIYQTWSKPFSCTNSTQSINISYGYFLKSFILHNPRPKTPCVERQKL